MAFLVSECWGDARAKKTTMNEEARREVVVDGETCVLEGQEEERERRE